MNGLSPGQVAELRQALEDSAARLARARSTAGQWRHSTPPAATEQAPRLLQALADALNACETAGLIVALEAGAAVTTAGYVLPVGDEPMFAGERYAARTALLTEFPPAPPRGGTLRTVLSGTLAGVMCPGSCRSMIPVMCGDVDRNGLDELTTAAAAIAEQQVAEGQCHSGHDPIQVGRPTSPEQTGPPCMDCRRWMTEAETLQATWTGPGQYICPRCAAKRP